MNVKENQLFIVFLVVVLQMVINYIKVKRYLMLKVQDLFILVELVYIIMLIQ